jgi:HSP20 family protein
LFPSIPSFFDDLFTKDVFDWTGANTGYGSSMPAVNISEDENKYEVEVAAPGLQKEDFNLLIDHNVLTISSEKEEKEEQKDKEGNYTRREFRYSSFKRSFTLPEEVVDAEKISANYVDGVLHIQIPKKEEAKPKPARTIKIG